MTKKSDNSGKTPPKIPQSNGGALYAGGVPGNKGGPGRPSNLARYKAGESVAKGVERMEELMFNAKDESNQIRAFEALVKVMPVLTGEDPENPSLTDAQRKAKLKALGLTR